ncbi:hypothetical protein Tco_0634469 [Tanacetum coccineum]
MIADIEGSDIMDLVITFRVIQSITNDDGNPVRANIKQSFLIERFNTSAGNPIKDILLKLNLHDHRSILTDSKIHFKVGYEWGGIPGSAETQRFIATCSNSTDKSKDIMKGQVHVSLNSATLIPPIQKKDDEDEWLSLIFKQIHINLPFLEAMIHMSKEAKVDTVNHDGKWTKEEEEEESNKVLAVSFSLRIEPVEPLEWKAPEN